MCKIKKGVRGVGEGCERCVRRVCEGCEKGVRGCERVVREGGRV